MWTVSQANSASTMRIKNKWIDGFVIACLCVGNAIAFPAIDARKLSLKGTLMRGGREIELFNTTLLNLVLLSHLRTPTFNFLFGGFVQMSAAGNTNTLTPLKFDFGGPLNLIGDDEFILEWSLDDTFFVAANGVVVANSSIQIDETETNEIEYYVPQTKTIVIEGSQENPTYSLGDNVTNIMFINLDKTTEKTADIVVKNYKLTSKTVTKNDNFNEMRSKKYSYYPDVNEANSRLQKYVIYEGADELDKVELNFLLDPANVVSAQNLILWRTFYTDDLLITRANVLADKKSKEADKKGKFNPALMNRMID